MLKLLPHLPGANELMLSTYFQFALRESEPLQKLNFKEVEFLTKFFTVNLALEKIVCSLWKHEGLSLKYAFVTIFAEGFNGPEWLKPGAQSQTT